MASLRKGAFGEYYGSTFNESEPLPASKQIKNAEYIYSYLISKGWTLNAIAGILGNMEAESSINPGRWQSDDVGNTSMGYGLVQWTPSTNYTDWCATQGFSDPSIMDANLSRIIYEVENGLQWIEKDSFPLSFKEFTTSTLDVEYLAKAFLINYERPKDQSTSVQNYRATLANSWYTYLSGATPNPPSGDGGGSGSGSTSRKRKSKFKFLIFTARKRRNLWIN